MRDLYGSKPLATARLVLVQVKLLQAVQYGTEACSLQLEAFVDQNTFIIGALVL